MRLYEKYKPISPDEAIGLAPVVRELSKRGGWLLISGPTGTGKSTLARLLAEAHGPYYETLNGRDVTAEWCRDFEKRRVGQAWIGNRSGIQPVVIEEAHTMPKAAREFIKTLADWAQPHTLFMLTTDREPGEAFPANGDGAREGQAHFGFPDSAFLDRFLSVKLKAASLENLAALVARVAAGERLKIGAGVAAGLARRAGGSYRRALDLLESLTVSARTGGAVEFAA